MKFICSILSLELKRLPFYALFILAYNRQDMLTVGME